MYRRDSNMSNASFVSEVEMAQDEVRSGERQTHCPGNSFRRVLIRALENFVQHLAGLKTQAVWFMIAHGARPGKKQSWLTCS